MDEYTRKTKAWLDERFKKCNEHGIYYAHQPLYGMRKGYSESRFVNRYIITYQIMKALSHLKFDSLLDIGGAEGYKAWIARELFGVKVKNSDLSEEACKRAEEIFHIESIPADILELPFENDEFDVALCSETLEHVTDLDKAIDELLRVAHKAVVITVPHEPKELIDKIIEEQIPHGHIHCFNLESFDFLESKGYQVFNKKMISPHLKKFSLYHLGKKAASLQIWLHNLVCEFTSCYEAILFVILKDKTCWRKEINQNISACRIINFTVPFYYLNYSKDRG
ncbi:MAG: class I SAM-dependent methyltransferase [Candidatus Omnitrophota bacterium]|nr:MAG: class I SAM-dependent methyltransferase [Candidatus Omnitrophota bacterium]